MKKSKKKYALGSYVKPLGKTGQGYAVAGNMLGSAIGGSAGNVISGVASGALAGGPLGAAIGGIGALVGNFANKRAEDRQKDLDYQQYNQAYQDQLISGMDTLNENPYGTVFAKGGLVDEISKINIEKGELQVDPTTGKILRDFTGINPENGEMYKPHSKGKDPKANFVTAEPGTFIITAKKAKDYKKAVEDNDKLLQNTILQNITNYKDGKVAKSDKYALGSYVDDVPPMLRRPLDPYQSWRTGIDMAASGITPGYLPTNLPTTPKIGGSFTPAAVNFSGATTSIPNRTGETGLNLDGILGGIGNYGVALANIGQGMFGKVEQAQRVNPTINPYKSNILNNMPQDINFEPVRQQLLRNQNTQFNQIDQTTSGSPIARANKLNVFANTQNQLGTLMMDNQVRNNQVRGQRASLYNTLGNQEMGAIDRAQQINLGIDEGNRANRTAKSNLLSTGLNQLQQAYQNNKANSSKLAMDKYKVDLLRQMFPNLKYYGSQFSEDAINNLIG